jgi:hypothetical protein
MPFPTFEPSVLANMFISGFIGFAFGMIGGWVAHLLAFSRDKRTRKWQELNYWRGVLAQYDREVQQIARVTIPLDYIYSDKGQDISSLPPLEQRLMIQARAARLRVDALGEELDMDPGLWKQSLPSQRSIKDWQ